MKTSDFNPAEHNITEAVRYAADKIKETREGDERMITLRENESGLTTEEAFPSLAPIYRERQRQSARHEAALRAWLALPIHPSYIS